MDNKRKAPAIWAADLPSEEENEILEPPTPPPPPASVAGLSKPTVQKEALLVCSDVTWTLYEPLLSKFYKRLTPAQCQLKCQPELLFESAEEALPEHLVEAMHHLMTEFLKVENEERLLELDARELPHAKMAGDRVTPFMEFLQLFWNRVEATTDLEVGFNADFTSAIGANSAGALSPFWHGDHLEAGSRTALGLPRRGCRAPPQRSYRTAGVVYGASRRHWYHPHVLSSTCASRPWRPRRVAPRRRRTWSYTTYS